MLVVAAIFLFLLPHNRKPMLRCFRNIVILLAGLFLHGSVSAQGEGDSKVFFLGIGIEKCTNGAPGKPNAVADVQLVMKRTQKDASSGDVNFTHNSTSLMVSKAICYTLLNDQATVRNIDSIINNVIKPLARPQDVFYLYISAQSSGLNGNFTVPAEPVAAGKTKSKTPGPQRAELESAHLKNLCAQLQCENQILVADAVTWQENHDALLTALLVPAAEGKNQIVVAPYTESPDSFQVAGKFVSAFAGSIHNAGQPLLRLLVKNTTVTTKVKTSLNNAYNALTTSDDPVAEVYESWKLIEGSVGPVAKVTQPEPQKTIPNPAPSAGPERVKRGFEGDAPAAEAVTKVRNFALIIANEHYANTAAWPTLYNPIADARAMEAELKTYYGYEVRVVVDVGLDSMLTEIENLNKMGFNQNSQVLFYYAGHGGVKRNASGSGTGYIVPVDGKPETEDKNLLTFVLYDRIKATLDALPAKHVLALVDACFSGSADRTVFAQEMQYTKKDADNVQRSSISVQINEAMKRESRYFIGSGKLTTVPDGARGKHSPFCAVILHQLETARDKKMMTTISGIEDVMMHELDPQPYGFSFGSHSLCNTYLFCPVSIIPK
jgi:hypothetical protein